MAVYPQQFKFKSPGCGLRPYPGYSLNLKPGRRCGTFWQAQKPYLDYHRSNVFEQKYKKLRDPVEDLFAEVSALK